jgi:hypothetical protein
MSRPPATEKRPGYPKKVFLHLRDAIVAMNRPKCMGKGT